MTTNNSDINRRNFMATSSVAALAAAMAATSVPLSSVSGGQSEIPQNPQDNQKNNNNSTAATQDDNSNNNDIGSNHKGECVISSGNGFAAVVRAMMLIQNGSDPVDAVVEGVGIVESDPNDMSVGYGGLPNEDGIVELDASVMHGPTHKAGAVAAIRNIKNPAAVALTVLRRTDHVMLVGEGATKFAIAHGFPEENLLTPRARQAWLAWKENLSPDDDWLNEDQLNIPQNIYDDDNNNISQPKFIPQTHGTINCLGVNNQGDIAGVTTTSGMSYKIPGRVGDSPIIGAGLYVDNNIGAAGATGRGEAVIQNCSAFATVQFMDKGLTPTEACFEAIKKIADNTKLKRLLTNKGYPDFNVIIYALRKDGAFGAASIKKGGTYIVHDGKQATKYKTKYLYIPPPSK